MDNVKCLGQGEYLPVASGVTFGEYDKELIFQAKIEEMSPLTVKLVFHSDPSKGQLFLKLILHN